MSDHLLSLLRAGGVGAIAAPPQPRPASHSPPPAPAANSNDSIDSLIARMTMAGGPQQPAQSGISSAQGRQNQLLGLLGGPTSPPPVLDQMSLHQRVISPPPAHAPSHGPAGGNGLMAQNLLDSLMGRTTPAHNAPAASNAEAHPLREPVVQHQSPAQHPPAPPAHRQPSFPAAPAPEAPQTVTPAKGTKFDFISPFDVFDEPPKPSSAKKPAASAQASLPIDAPHSPAKKAKKPKQPEMSAPSASTITPSMSISQRKSPVGADRAVSQTGGKRKADEIKLLGSARSFAKPDPALLPLVLKNIGYTLDLRTTDPVGIVADENAIEERKISITKTDTMTAGLTFGQTISASEAIVAYVMSKGRVRVLRQDDGVNELVTLTKADGMPETIKDIDVTDQYVAVLTESGTLALYEIEQRADDTMALRQISRSDRGSSFTHALPKKVRLSTRDAEHVYVMDTSAVYSIEISTLAENPDKNWIDLSGTTYRLPEDMGELGSSKPVDFDISKRHAILGVVGEDGAYAVFKLGDATPTAKGQIVGGLASSIVVMYPSIVIGFERGQSYATLMVSEDGKSGSVCTLNLKTGDVADLPKGALVTLATEGNEPCTLWIANYFRSSILSVSIGRRSGKFLRAIEFPLEAVGHVAIHKATSDDRSWSFFYKHAKGFSQALVQDSSKYANMLLVDEDPEDVPPETRPDGINAHFAETMPQTTINADEEMQSDPREEPQVAPAADDSQLARFETVLQREIRLLGKNQVTQLEKLKLASQVEEIERQQTLVRLVSDALDNDVKTHLQRVVQDEIKAQLIPSAEAIVKKAIQDATGPKLAERINKGIESTVLAQVEKVLLPRLEESLNKSLEPIVERKIQSLAEQKIVPMISRAVETLPTTLSNAISQEMSTLRKDLTQAQAQLAASKQTEASIAALTATITTMSADLKAMQQQVVQMQSQVAARQAPVMSPAPVQAQQPPAMAIAPPPPQQQLQPAPPPSEDFEEYFLHAFGQFSGQDLVKAVMDKHQAMMFYLPDARPGVKPVLSQAVMLTGIHKLSGLLAGRHPGMFEFQVLLDWMARASVLLNVQDPSLRPYIPGVLTAVQTNFEGIRRAIVAAGPNTPAHQAAMGRMSVVLQNLSRGA